MAKIKYLARLNLDLIQRLNSDKIGYVSGCRALNEMNIFHYNFEPIILNVFITLYS